MCQRRPVISSHKLNMSEQKFSIPKSAQHSILEVIFRFKRMLLPAPKTANAKMAEKKCGPAIKEMWRNCLQHPKQIVQYSVLFACSIVVIFQTSECFSRLRYPPITTLTSLDMNQSMSYPAITLCRDPPYKPKVMLKYGLAYHPRFTSAWERFPFDTANLSVFWEEATYPQQEYFIPGHPTLNGLKEHLEVVSTMHFIYGQCMTLLPQVVTHEVSMATGYNMHLLHDMADPYETTSEVPPGWHVFIHEPGESFTEQHGSGRVEYVYIEVFEAIQLKLTVQDFSLVPSTPNRCRQEEEYSVNECEDSCHWGKVTELVGCGGPWMTGLNLTDCSNYDDIRSVIVEYLNKDTSDVCKCPVRCKTVHYNSYLVNRKSYGSASFPGGFLSVFYASKMVSNTEERWSYDFSQFVADMGGSLGFLLGLSVLGLLSLFEKLLVFVIYRFLPVPQMEDFGDKNTESDIAVSNKHKY